MANGDDPPQLSIPLLGRSIDICICICFSRVGVFTAEAGDLERSDLAPLLLAHDWVVRWYS